MTIFEAFLTLIVPVLGVFLILLILDPIITSNYGKGLLLAYGSMLLVVPIFLILIVTVILQKLMWDTGFKDAMVINLGITLAWVSVVVIINVFLIFLKRLH